MLKKEKDGGSSKVDDKNFFSSLCCFIFAFLKPFFPPFKQDSLKIKVSVFSSMIQPSTEARVVQSWQMP